MNSSGDGGMKYRLFGSDGGTTDEKIAQYTGEVPWSYLRPHCLKGNLLWVDPSLDLAAVARAFASDETLTVAEWLGRGDLVRVGDLHAAQWEGTDKLFTAVVVTPFVLFQGPV